MHQRFSNVAPNAVPCRPRCLRLVPFLVCTPALTPRQWQVLGLIAAASLFDRYDLALFSLALTQIQTGLGIAEGALGTLGASVRLGALGGTPHAGGKSPGTEASLAGYHPGVYPPDRRHSLCT